MLYIKVYHGPAALNTNKHILYTKPIRAMVIATPQCACFSSDSEEPLAGIVTDDYLEVTKLLTGTERLGRSGKLTST